MVLILTNQAINKTDTCEQFQAVLVQFIIFKIILISVRAIFLHSFITYCKKSHQSQLQEGLKFINLRDTQTNLKILDDLPFSLLKTIRVSQDQQYNVDVFLFVKNSFQFNEISLFLQFLTKIGFFPIFSYFMCYKPEFCHFL